MRLANARDRKVGTERAEGTLSLIIPVYNELRKVAITIGRLRQLPIRVQIVVVDDRSIDRTAALLEALRDAGRRRTGHPAPLHEST